MLRKIQHIRRPFAVRHKVRFFQTHFVHKRFDGQCIFLHRVGHVRLFGAAVRGQIQHIHREKLGKLHKAFAPGIQRFPDAVDEQQRLPAAELQIVQRCFHRFDLFFAGVVHADIKNDFTEIPDMRFVGKPLALYRFKHCF